MEIKEGLGFVELILDSVDDFIELIRPEKCNLNRYLESTGGKFIYRGHADSQWELEPSLFRAIASDSFFSKTFEGICFTHLQRLKAFVEGCDLNASNIPFDSKKLRDDHFKDFKSQVGYDSRAWPHAELYELIALAQHYGVCTEFLDWTKNPLVACYFAASKVVASKDSNGFMSVWVFDVEKEDSLNHFLHKNIEIINVPRSANRNVSSQQGCFTLVRQSLDSRSPLTFENGTKRIREIKLLNELIAEREIKALIKISLPKKYAPQIMQYCSSYSINGATIFRGVEGAAIYARETVDQISFQNDLT